MNLAFKAGLPGIAGISSLFVLSLANAATVSSFGPGGWDRVTIAGGAAELVSIAGEGGDLETNAPLGAGVARLTTGDDNADKAEIGIAGNFGTVGDFINGGSLSYSYFKSSLGDLNAFAAAAIKLTILDNAISDSNGGAGGDGYTTFVYEPYWNTAGAVGAAVAVNTDVWQTASIFGDSGIFWHTGIYGRPNQAGGVGTTLTEWNNMFGGDLADAFIVGISIGVGAYNRGQTAYVDDVRFSNMDLSLQYDFEAAVVPLPAALPLFAFGLGAVGCLSRRKKAPRPQSS